MILTRLAAGAFAGMLALSAFQAAPAPVKPEDPKLASIEGKVIHALSNDPLKKVTVVLMRTGGGAGTQLSAETDDKGAFSFQRLEPGRYQMLAERTGFARQAYGARRNALQGTSIQLSAGQEIRELIFKLSPNAVITGRVLDEDGDPVPNVAVMALRTIYQRGKKQFLPLGAVPTNDMGEYRLASLMAGKYLVSATFRNAGIGIAGTSSKPPDPDKPEPSYTTTYYPNSTDPLFASPVEVAVGGEMRGIDVRLTKVKAFRVKGKVAEGLSQGKQLVVLLTPKGAGITGMVTRLIGVAQPDGSFELKGVAPGSYYLTATTDGMSTLGAAREVVVTDQHIDGLRLEAATALEIQGTVALEGKPGVDLKKVQVTLESTEMLNINPPKGKPEDDGKFTMKGISPDRYRVSASGPDGVYLKSARYGTQEVGDDGVDLSSATGKLEIVMAQDGAQVEGGVCDSDGKPVPGATVVLVPSSRNWPLYKEMTTDQNGRFQFRTVPPGDYRLFAWTEMEPGAYQNPEFLKGYKGELLELKGNDKKVVAAKAAAVE
jgi:protocatechuate 3,4-dioxygenase beta subunit